MIFFPVGVGGVAKHNLRDGMVFWKKGKHEKLKYGLETSAE